MVHTTKSSGNVTYLTENGLAELQAELDYLLNIKREEVAQNLRDAIDNEEPCENGEFMLAKNEQSWVEGRICVLKRLLANVKIIKPGSEIGQVTLGSTVTVQENSLLPSETYTIVGTAEANTKRAYISDESPMGSSLLGHKVGDVIEIRAPDGTFRVRIISVT